jgi:hypothetical protein
MHRDVVELHDEEIYKSFLGGLKERKFVRASKPTTAPVEKSDVLLSFKFVAVNDFIKSTR